MGAGGHHPRINYFSHFQMSKLKLVDFQKIQKWRKDVGLRFSNFGSQMVKNLCQDHQQHPTLHSGWVSRGRVCGCDVSDMWQVTGDTGHMTWHDMMGNWRLSAARQQHMPKLPKITSLDIIIKSLWSFWKINQVIWCNPWNQSLKAHRVIFSRKSLV